MKRALAVGIDNYPGAPLFGCVADANNMAAVLATHENGDKNYDVRLATSDHETIDRPRLRGLLAELFDNAAGAEIVFYFAGHGAQTPWGGELVTQDLKPHALGVSMDDIITLANSTPAREIVVILDCCHSGDLGNVAALQPGAVAAQFQVETALLREGLTILSAARAVQASTETGAGGEFTRALLDGLQGGAADLLGEVTSLSLYAFASRLFGAWDHRPVFKSHLSGPAVLRTCKSSLDRAMLRRLPEFFTSADERVRMNPSYEGEGRPLPPGVPGTAEQQAFDYFKQLRNAGLLTSDGSRDLYFVAMASEDVFLTPAGRYVWRLAITRQL